MNKRLYSAASAGMLAALIGFAAPVYGQETFAPDNTTNAATDSAAITAPDSAAIAEESQAIRNLESETVGRINRMISLVNEMETTLNKMSTPAPSTPDSAVPAEPNSEALRDASPRSETEQPAPGPEILPEQPEVFRDEPANEPMPPMDEAEPPINKESTLQEDFLPLAPNEEVNQFVIPEPSDDMSETITEPVTPMEDVIPFEQDTEEDNDQALPYDEPALPGKSEEENSETTYDPYGLGI